MTRAGRMAAVSIGGPFVKPNDGAMLWFDRLMPALDQDALWGAKPCDVTRDGLEELQRGLQNLPDWRLAGGLAFIEAISSHYTAHDIEVDMDAHVAVSEDSFEVEG